MRSELSAEKRGIILQKHFHEGQGFTAIAQSVPGVKADTACKLCQRARERAGSNRLDKLLEASHTLPRPGRPRRVEPGSSESIRIRQALRGPNRFQDPVKAANKIHKRQRTTSDRIPLQPLNVSQVHNITRGTAHCKGDTIDARPIKRLRGVQKTALAKLDLPDRKQYIHEILDLPANEVVLIATDETVIDFGGSPHQRVTAPEGTRIFVDSYSPSFMIRYEPNRQVTL